MLAAAYKKAEEVTDNEETNTEGPKGKGLRELKEKAPEVVARMGYNKGGAIINKPKNEIKKRDPKVGTGKKPKEAEGDYIPMKIRRCCQH